MQRFRETFPELVGKRIIDIGGYPWFWVEHQTDARITVVNLHTPDFDLSRHPNIEFVEGDGCDLNYPDGLFDISFSNSVIEHLGTWEKQMRFASEARRVSRSLWIQTPAKEFFFEPHFLTPFIHWLPKDTRKGLAKHFTTWGLITRPSQEEVNLFVDEIRLLTFGEMSALFPECIVQREQILGCTKCYIAVNANNGF